MFYLRAFIAGLVLPSVFLPIFLCVASVAGKSELLTLPFLHVIPLVWGIWNIIYFALLRQWLPEDINIRLLLTGAILGILVAIYGVFWLAIPEIFGLSKPLAYFPLITVPVVYALLWRYVVKPLNWLLGLPKG